MDRIVGFLCPSALLASCSTGGRRADFEFKQISGTSVFESENDFASTVVNGRFRVVNNTWNKGASSGRTTTTPPIARITGMYFANRRQQSCEFAEDEKGIARLAEIRAGF